MARGGTVLTGFVAGLIGGMLAPVIMPELLRNARPGLKRAMRFSLDLFDRARESLGTFSETASDLMAEVRAEREAEERVPAETGSAEKAAGAVVTPIEASHAKS